MAFEPSGIAPEASDEVMEVCHSKVFGRQRQPIIWAYSRLKAVSKKEKQTKPKVDSNQRMRPRVDF